jgi:hypothetical protein
MGISYAGKYDYSFLVRVRFRKCEKLVRRDLGGESLKVSNRPSKLPLDKFAKTCSARLHIVRLHCSLHRLVVWQGKQRPDGPFRDEAFVRRVDHY